MKSLSRIAATLLAATAVLLPATAAAQSQRGLDARSARAVQHWTPERRAAAIPRDFVIDERGLGYIRGRGGILIPHGHDIAAQAGPPGGGGGGGDLPVVSNMSPGEGDEIGASATFSAAVSDANGVKSVSINVRKGTGAVQSFSATQGASGAWSVSLSGFTDGDWSWYVVAKDKAKPTNTTTSDVVHFSVNTAGGGGGGGDGTNEEWTGGGVVQQAAGRIYFEMPSNKRRTRWVGYVCSGTVATEPISGRSIIITAAHCVYDDVNKAYAANVLFIPNQALTTGTGTDSNCSNDPKGCWAPDFGVVHTKWTASTFPANVEWDYAYYVVNDVGAHSGTGSHTALDAATAAGSMAVQFTAPTLGDVTHGLGYSYSEDPNFMYCVDPLGIEGAVNWWLPDCGLSGGSSGGPWVQPLTGGNGPIISVNSWGYTNQPGMAGPKLAAPAECVFNVAKNPLQAPLGVAHADGDAGVTVTNCP